MLSFRKKISLWCGGLLLLSLTIVTFVFFLCILYQLFREEHKELKTLARGIKGQIALLSVPKKPPVPKVSPPPMDPPSQLSEHIEEGLIENINEKLSFLFDEDDFNIGYSILGPSGKRVYQFYRTPTDPMADINLEKEGFSFRIVTYKDWIFYYLETGSPFNVLTSSSHHLKIIDKILLSFLILLPVGGVLTFFLGSKLSNKVLVPFDNISVAASKIQKGELCARISPIKSGDELERLIHDLNQTFSRLETSFNQIKQFSADAAHELKTPLTAIRGNLEVCLRRPRTVEEYEKTLCSAVDEIAFLNKIIDQLLLLAKSGKGAEPKNMKPVNFSVLVTEAIEQLRILGEEKHISIRSAITEDIIVNGITIYLKQLCFNLIQNAIKFSPLHTTVTLNLMRDQNQFLLEVIDQGIGIAAEDRKKIFDRFFQVEKSRRSGTGLGLALAKWIVEIHDGTISVESQQGQGTTFRIKIPILQEKNFIPEKSRSLGK